MGDVFGPCPLCGCPREYDHLRESLLCVGCGAEFVNFARSLHAVQVITTREAEEQRRWMSESEQEALIRWRKGWGAW